MSGDYLAQKMRREQYRDWKADDQDERSEKTLTEYVD